MKKGIGLSDTFAASLMAMALSYIFWQSLHPEAIVIFVCLLIVMEILILMRHRLAVVCQYCGFDPHVYRKHPEKAAALVKQRIEQLELTPDSLLSQKTYQLLKQFRPHKASQATAKNLSTPTAPILPPEKKASRLQMKV
ncbi:MAG: hypothetical protein AB7F59_04885 [Bdellovibrionales bacterium]